MGLQVTLAMDKVVLKSPEEIEGIAAASRITAEALALCGRAVAPGIETCELDALVERFIRVDRGAEPAFLGYHGYPASICVSINEEVVHGIPKKRALVEGDIVSIDVGVRLGRFYGDAAATFPVGQVDADSQRLMKATREALEAGIREARAGSRLTDISHAIERRVRRDQFAVVRALVGHGVGLAVHEDPQVPNYGPRGRGPVLKEGMVLAIEPMVNVGTYEVEVLADGWTVITRDRSRSAHFEHTVAITANGPRILTALPQAA
jgi:methionyl aminopeptidase